MIAFLEMPEQREMTISRDSLFNFRHVNREATLIFSMKNLRIETAACDRCQRNRSAFVNCVVVFGFFKKTCVNCHYDDKANKCSFRSDK